MGLQIIFINYHVVGFDPFSPSRYLGFMSVSLRIFANVTNKFRSHAIRVLIQLMASILYLNTGKLPPG